MSKTPKAQSEFIQWMGPLLDCLRAVGGSAKPREVVTWIQRELKVSTDVATATLKSGGNRFTNQVHWARQYLVWDGLLDDSKHGLWTLTPLGWKTLLDGDASRELFLRRVKINQDERKQSERETAVEATEAHETLAPSEIPEQNLLAVILSLPPRGFELLCERLLREHGFEDVVVTQQSRDGGIDGYGVLRLSPFVTMKVAFQAKRYKDVVPRRDVGEFRNALLGRAEKGVFITTGRFSPDAEKEASRDGVVPIELVDGEALVDLFEKAELGVRPKRIFEIDQSFFDQFRNKQA